MSWVPWPYFKHNADGLTCECRGCNEVNVLAAALAALTGGTQ